MQRDACAKYRADPDKKKRIPVKYRSLVHRQCPVPRGYNAQHTLLDGCPGETLETGWSGHRTEARVAFVDASQVKRCVRTSVGGCSARVLIGRLVPWSCCNAARVAGRQGSFQSYDRVVCHHMCCSCSGLTIVVSFVRQTTDRHHGCAGPTKCRMSSDSADHGLRLLSLAQRCRCLTGKPCLSLNRLQNNTSFKIGTSVRAKAE